MAANSTFAKIIDAALVPIALAIAWAMLGVVTQSFIPDGPLIDGAYLAVRVALAVAAGWSVVRRSDLGLWHAAVAGALLMFADHVLVKGVWFLATGEFMAAGGVLLSYVMFFWVAMLVSTIGGIAARIVPHDKAAI